MTLAEFLYQNGGAIFSIIATLAGAYAITARSAAKNREIAAQTAAASQQAVHDTLVTIRTERATLQAKVFEQVQTIADLRIDVARSESRYDVLKAQIETLNERVNLLNTQLQLAHRNADDAVARAEREEIRANQLAGQLQEKQAEVERLEARVTELETRLAVIEKTQKKATEELKQVAVAVKPDESPSETRVLDDVQKSLQPEGD